MLTVAMLLLRTLIFTLLLVPAIAYGQAIEEIVKKFTSYHQQTPFEKAYLHTDKEIYAQDETLWFSAYLADGASFVPGTLSKLLYVDLFDPENKLVATRSVKIDNGSGAGEFFLADSLPAGTYRLMAYTNYMRNFSPDYFFSKPVKLVKFNRDSRQHKPAEPAPPAIDLQLFPEGGYLVAGLANKVAFRATNRNGNGIDLKADIVDGQGEVIKSISTRHLGMGVFQFIPVAGQRYRVEFQFEGEPFSLPFPEIKQSGYQLAIRQNPTKIYLTVGATPGLSFDDGFVLAHVRGQVVAVVKASPGKNYIYHEFKHSALPAGIIHFTFFKNGQPILERLAYVPNPAALATVTTTLANKNLGGRELARFDLMVAGNDTTRLNGNLSVSVLRATDAPNKVDIANFLLLTADLNGTVERPDYYFNRENPDRLQALDLLMMTHGWRRFAWQDILNDSLPPITYYPETGFSIEGQVVDYHNRKKARPTLVSLSFLEDINFKLQAETTADGHFWFDGLDVADTVTAVLRTVIKDPKKSARKKAKRKGLGDEISDSGTYIKVEGRSNPEPVIKVPDTVEPKENYEQLLAVKEEIELIDSAFDEKTIVLEGIEVKGKRDRRSDPFYRDRTVMPYASPDSRVILDSINGPDNYIDVFSLVSRVFPAVRVVIDQNGLKQLLLRGDTLAVYLDGIELIAAGQLYAINPATIEFIDLMRGLNPVDNQQYPPPRSLYIFTRKSGKKSDPKGLQLVTMYGYHQPAEFYVPRYDLMSKKEQLKPDFRTTQYWHPQIKLNGGQASVSYYTSDNTGDFVMYIEGLATNGKIIKSKFRFTVE